MWSFLQDAKYGWRMLWRNPGFTVIAVVIIALGIGANTAIFSVIDAVLLRPFPFADPDHLLVIWEDASFMGFPRNAPAPANFIDWKKQNRVFLDMAALADRGLNLTGDGDPEKMDGYATSWNVFSILGVKPMLGRTFLPEDDKPGGQKVVLISHGLWRRRFGGDAALVGRDTGCDEVGALLLLQARGRGAVSAGAWDESQPPVVEGGDDSARHGA